MKIFNLAEHMDKKQFLIYKLQIQTPFSPTMSVTKNYKLRIKNYCFGFSLIELLLYVAITSVIGFGIVSFLMTSVQSRVKNQTIAEVEQQGQQVMLTITQTIRNAQTVTTPALGASASTLSVTTISASTSPTVFDVASGAIRITEGATAAVALTTSQVIASGLTFTNLGQSGTEGSIRIQFTLAHVNTVGRNEFDWSKTFITTASLR
jgi:Tfp pilus assembly protein PilW